MKPLLPTLKERQRYIVYQIISAHQLGQDISEPLLHRLSEILGVFGTAEAGILSVSYDKQSQTGVLRCDHDNAVRVRAALLLITHLGRTQVIIRTKGISGILAKSKRFMPKSARIFAKESTKGVR